MREVGARETGVAIPVETVQHAEILPVLVGIAVRPLEAGELGGVNEDVGHAGGLELSGDVLRAP